MCNNNYNGGYPYNSFPINYNSNRDRDCCFDFDNFHFAPEERRITPRIHLGNHRNRNHAHNHRHNIVRFREFEQDFQDDSCFDRSNNDREFDRGNQFNQPFAFPYDAPYYNNGYYDNGYYNGGY